MLGKFQVIVEYAVMIVLVVGALISACIDLGPLT